MDVVAADGLWIDCMFGRGPCMDVGDADGSSSIDWMCGRGTYIDVAAECATMVVG